MCEGRTGREGRKGGGTECGGPVGFGGGGKGQKQLKGRELKEAAINSREVKEKRPQPKRWK